MVNTIEEQAKVFLKKRNHQRGSMLITINEALNGLIDFAKSTQEWISVEAEYPLTFESSLDWDGLRSEEIAFKDRDGNKYFGRFYSGTMDGFEFNDFTDSNFTIQDVTHWRYF